MPTTNCVFDTTKKISWEILRVSKLNGYSMIHVSEEGGRSPNALVA